jgi:hypothetical protein
MPFLSLPAFALQKKSANDKIINNKISEVRSTTPNGSISGTDTTKIILPVYNDLREKLDTIYGDGIYHETTTPIKEEWFFDLPYYLQDGIHKDSFSPFYVSFWKINNTFIYLNLNAMGIRKLGLSYGTNEYYSIIEKLYKNEIKRDVDNKGL